MEWEWIKGNKPLYSGWYWITVQKFEDVYMCDYPVRYIDGNWEVDDNDFCADDIIAFKDSYKPLQPYDDNHMGYPDQYYIRVSYKGTVNYLAKGLKPVRWSKLGYSTKQKAVEALNRYLKLNKEQGYSEIDAVIINGYGQQV